MKGALKKILRWIALSLCALILGLTLYGANASKLLGQQMPMPFGYGAAVVLSGSMEPTIAIDELIIVRAQEDYTVGDIVVYQTGRTPIVHRIVSIDGEDVITRGDANNTNDDPIAFSRIKGKVILHIPYMGMVVRLLKTPPATILLIVIAVLLVELPYRKEKSKKNEELERIKEEIRRLKEQQDD